MVLYIHLVAVIQERPMTVFSMRWEGGEMSKILANHHNHADCLNWKMELRVAVSQGGTTWELSDTKLYNSLESGSSNDDG